MSTYSLPNVVPNQSAIEFISNTEAFQSPFNGAIQTLDRSGERLGMTLSWRGLEGANRRKLQSLVATLNGQQHRVSLRDHSYSGPSGNLTVNELIDVAFNATNWEAQASAGDRGSIAALSEGVRFRTGVDQQPVVVHPTTSADGISAPTTGHSYVAVLQHSDGRASYLGGSAATVRMDILQADWGSVFAQGAVSSVAGRQVTPFTAPSASVNFVRPFLNTGGGQAYDASIDLLSLSVSRCLLIDNGFNAAATSEAFDGAFWDKTRSSITANAAVAPDGNTTAEEFIEDATASQTHYIFEAYTRASVAEFWTASVYLKKNTNQRIRLDVEDGAANGGMAYFDADSGTITFPATAQGTGALAYASIHDAGNGWYRCRITARLQASALARIIIYMADGANNVRTYTGDGSSSVYLWGAQLQRGGQLGRYTKTEGTATTGTAQTGSQIYVKGLDASVNQQLLAGDQVEINGQLCILQTDLDGDEYGCGLLEIKPRIRTAPADEDPVILYRPHGTFLLADNTQSWSNRPGVFSDLSLKFVEDIT